MAENLIFAAQELAFASVEELGGAYAHDFESGNQFTMAVGQTYRVVWDGEPWDAVAWDASAYVDDTIGVGNAALLGLSGTNEPFLIAWSPNGTVILSYDAEASHRIAIYQVVEEETFLVVKKSSMKSVADSIRAKAGVEGDLEWPAGYKAAIEGITAGGGGSSEDVRYVTFMSDDGTEELGKIPVATGYDCPNPKFTATKESTAQFHFTHDYWATEPNGATDRNVLKSITEDKVVYATFISVLRSYTITYNDADGSELNKQTLTYGSMPSYKPEKDGFIFAGWEPALAEVTGDASYTATWSEKLTFAGATWADIARIAESGEASQHFAVGDSRMIPIAFLNNRTYEVECRIVGFDLDERYDGGGKAGITCAFVPAIGISTYNSADAYDRSLVCNTSDSHDQKRDVLYPAQHYRNDINTKMFGMLPESLRNVIKTVYKDYIFTDTSNKQTTKTFQETLWVLDGDEATRTYAEATPAARQGIYGDTKNTVAMTTNTVEYLTRDDGYMPVACTVVTAQGNTRNNAGYSTTNSTHFVAVGFCI